jgi:hypothetical protein
MFPGKKDVENLETMDKSMERFGFTWEHHEVVTEDDYILSLMRITGSIEEGPFTITKPPILIAHGLSADAAKWISLPFFHALLNGVEDIALPF